MEGGRKAPIVLVDPPSKGNKNLPNIGLAYLAAAFKARGEDVKVIDYNLRVYPEDRHLIPSKWFGISVRGNTYHSTIRLISQYRNQFPKTEIILGGVEATLNPTDPRLKWDRLVIWEGDGERLANFDSTDLDSLPFPDYEAFDSFTFLREGWLTGSLNYPLITSRGCPYNCSFCCTPKFYKQGTWRKRSVDNCIEELKLAVERYGIHSFEILDDNFTADKNRALEFCEKVEPLRLPWACWQGLRADRFDGELARAAFKAGCRGAAFGVESTDPDVLKFVNKGETLEKIEDGIRAARDAGINCCAYFIIGLPRSSFDGDYAGFNWARQLGVRSHAAYLIPFKGTDVISQIEDCGGKILEDYRGALFFGEGAHPIVEYPNYSREQMKQVYEVYQKWA